MHNVRLPVRYNAYPCRKKLARHVSSNCRLSLTLGTFVQKGAKSKMRINRWCSLALVLLLFCPYTNTLSRELRLPIPRRFLLHRMTMVNEKACACSSPTACSCCESVFMAYSRTRKKLCSNFMYQGNALNVDISLNTEILKTMSVTNVRPFMLCTAIPGTSFSSICVNVYELNLFPRSITACVRHEIVSKSQEWRIDYTCMSISTVPISLRLANDLSGNSTSSPSGMSPTPGGTVTPVTATMAPPTMMMTSPPVSMPTMATTVPVTMTSATQPMPATSATTMTMATMPAAALVATTTVAAQEKRMKRFTRNRHFLKHRSGIINDAIDDIPSTIGYSKLTNSPIKAAILSSTSISNDPTVFVASPLTITSADTGDFDPSQIAANYGEATFIVEKTGVSSDRSEYFPSRIPPVVLITLKNNTKIMYPTNDEPTYIANDNRPKNKQSGLIFPD